MAHIVETTGAKQVVEKISYEDFLKKYTDVHAEWVGGEVINLMTSSDRHQDLVRWLITILSLFVESYDLVWLRPAPFNMRIPHLDRGREPDILFVAKSRMGIVQSSHLTDVADLVIEIVSPESVGRDRGEKYVEYETAGIREYWLIDPDRQQAEFYQFTDTGHYRPATLDEAGLFHSTVLPNFWLRVEWLWQEPLPKVLAVVRELGLLEE